jgi:hypothetical protein
LGLSFVIVAIVAITTACKNSAKAGQSPFSNGKKWTHQDPTEGAKYTIANSDTRLLHFE